MGEFVYEKVCNERFNRILAEFEDLKKLLDKNGISKGISAKAFATTIISMAMIQIAVIGVIKFL